MWTLRDFPETGSCDLEVHNASHHEAGPVKPGKFPEILLARLVSLFTVPPLLPRAAHNYWGGGVCGGGCPGTDKV